MSNLTIHLAVSSFTGHARWFEGKPATVRVKIRALKKDKDAALAG